MEVTSYLLGKKSSGGGDTPTGTIDITSNGTTNVTNYATANVNVQPDLETKSVTITENTTTLITPTTGKDGLSSVSVTTNVSGGGSSEYNAKLGGTRYSGEGVKYLVQKVGSDFDASSFTDLSRLFSGCSNLQSVGAFDMSSATNASSMFEGCYNLTEVGLLNLSNVTASGSMFAGCSSLTTIPQFNTSKMTGGYRMFYGCTNLQNVPVLDTSKMTNNMSGIFGYCTSLTNESLNNILRMCINCPATTNKTLAYIGISEEQATTCTTLSNYQDFLEAGWTTGY